jgi:hypothetical protein
MAKKTKPTGLTLHAYQVGFGDCFLLSWHYASGVDRNILIDFGSTGLPAKVPKNQMLLIAQDIATTCSNKLDAVVLTHRHRDHMSGFETRANGKGPGDIIRGLKPEIVVQPWTEDPKAKRDATQPTEAPADNFSLIRSLRAQRVAVQNVLAEAQVLMAARSIDRDKLALQSVVAEGMEGILNRSAVENLQTMAPANRHRYVFHGSASGLGALLPGVTVTVLGPPTLKQTETIRKQTATQATEFWMIQALDAAFWQMQARNAKYVGGGGARRSRAAEPLPHGNVLRGPLPFYARWFVPRVRAVRANELLGIVRVLDTAMNNTSVILLFEVGSAKLLFPGDAQFENWNFTLTKPELMTRLAGVTMYKVGHHGSRNATPKSLWNKFTTKSATASATRLKTVMSTMAGKFPGGPGKTTEVPRQSLVTALKENSDFFTTQTLVKKGGTLKKTFEFTF